jgi:hypothetical protein
MPSFSSQSVIGCTAAPLGSSQELFDEVPLSLYHPLSARPVSQYLLALALPPDHRTIPTGAYPKKLRAQFVGGNIIADHRGIRIAGNLHCGQPGMAVRRYSLGPSRRFIECLVHPLFVGLGTAIFFVECPQVEVPHDLLDDGHAVDRYPLHARGLSIAARLRTGSP